MMDVGLYDDEDDMIGMRPELTLQLADKGCQVKSWVPE